MNFKHGDKVTCYIDGVYIDDAKISIDDTGLMHLCQSKLWSDRFVSTADDNLGYTYSCLAESNIVTDLKLARTEITWDNLQEGDVIIHIDGDEDLVRGICGSIIFLSPVEDKNYVRGYYAKEELMEGCIIKQPSQPIPDETQKAIELLQANGYKVTKE